MAMESMTTRRGVMGAVVVSLSMIHPSMAFSYAPLAHLAPRAYSSSSIASASASLRLAASPRVTLSTSSVSRKQGEGCSLHARAGAHQYLSQSD